MQELSCWSLLFVCNRMFQYQFIAQNLPSLPTCCRFHKQSHLCELCLAVLTMICFVKLTGHHLTHGLCAIPAQKRLGGAAWRLFAQLAALRLPGHTTGLSPKNAPRLRLRNPRSYFTVCARRELSEGRRGLFADRPHFTSARVNAV